MKNIDEKVEMQKHFNKLLSIIVDRNLFEQTKHLSGDSEARINMCIQITKNQYSHAISLQLDCVPDAKRMISEANRKLEYLQSLIAIIKYI